MAIRSGGATKSSSDIRFLPCRVEPGMFRDEFLVYVDAIDPSHPERKIKVQMLADQREVSHVSDTPRRNSPVSGWLSVTLAGEEGGVSRIILPQPAQPVGESMLVHSKELRKEVAK